MSSISVPKAFISYSWSSADRVLELAQRLVKEGVDIVLDKWDLKEGQDKYAFMERSVSDETIEKVLMICDKAYAEKADKREGGVGDETIVISPEVYENTKETKFIPIIFEKDDEGKAYRPAYLKSRIFIDLTDGEQYEKEYEKLLRNLHHKPEYSKPLIGKMPEWLNDESVDLSGVRSLVKQVQAYDGKNLNKIDFIVRNFNDEFIKTLIAFAPVNDAEYDQNLLKQIDAVKPLRDLYLDYLESCIMSGLNIAVIIGDYFEYTNNTLNIGNGSRYYTDRDCEFYEYFIWDAYICTTALLIHYEKYAELYKVLNRTYFLRSDRYNSNFEALSYTGFSKNFRTIEEICKPKSTTPSLYTLSGEKMINRERKPVIDKISIVNADLILYQMSLLFDLTKMQPWFPTTYCYWEYNKQQIWSRLISKAHCFKIFPLFGVSTIEELKNAIEKCVDKRNIGYGGWCGGPMKIQNNIDLDQIGILP